MAENVLYEALNRLKQPESFNQYWNYLVSEWLQTFEDLKLASEDEIVWSDLKLPVRLKLELKNVIKDFSVKNTLKSPKSTEQIVPEVSENVDEAWVVYFSDEHQAYYYYNTITGESQWAETETNANSEYNNESNQYDEYSEDYYQNDTNKYAYNEVEDDYNNEPNIESENVDQSSRQFSRPRKHQYQNNQNQPERSIRKAISSSSSSDEGNQNPTEKKNAIIKSLKKEKIQQLIQENEKLLRAKERQREQAKKDHMNKYRNKKNKSKYSDSEDEYGNEEDDSDDSFGEADDLDRSYRHQINSDFEDDDSSHSSNHSEYYIITENKAGRKVKVETYIMPKNSDSNFKIQEEEPTAPTDPQDLYRQFPPSPEQIFHNHVRKSLSMDADGLKYCNPHGRSFHEKPSTPSTSPSIARDQFLSPEGAPLPSKAERDVYSIIKKSRDELIDIPEEQNALYRDLAFGTSDPQSSPERFPERFPVKQKASLNPLDGKRKKHGFFNIFHKKPPGPPPGLPSGFPTPPKLPPPKPPRVRPPNPPSIEEIHEQNVLALVNMGFDKASAESALSISNENLQEATDMLIESQGVPRDYQSANVSEITPINPDFEEIAEEKCYRESEERRSSEFNEEGLPIAHEVNTEADTVVVNGKPKKSKLQRVGIFRLFG